MKNYSEKSEKRNKQGRPRKMGDRMGKKPVRKFKYHSED